MAFVFLVEDGTGLSAATSYVSVAKADDYLAVKTNAAAWALLTTEVKEQYLSWATRLLDQRVYWQGSKTVATSALRWPRTGMTDRDCLGIDYNTVPTQVEWATIEVANHLLTQNVDPSAPIAGTDGDIARIKADVIEIEYVQGSATSRSNWFPLGLNDILRGLGTLNAGNQSGFGRIVRV